MINWLKKHRITKGDAFIMIYTLSKCIILLCMIFYKTQLWWYIGVITFTLLACNTIMYIINPKWAGYLRSPFLWNYSNNRQSSSFVENSFDLGLSINNFKDGEIVYVMNEHRYYIKENNKFIPFTYEDYN